MSYSPEDIRNHLSGAVQEARDMLQDALDELELVENTICDLEGQL
tara:strand:+ start:256 stop:390 length:135 start_codon:yes stop_codon:yes gene_type:complete